MGENKPVSIADEVPFEIPESWEWVRLGEYAEKITDQVASGSFASLRANVPSLKEKDFAIMIKTADFSNGFTRNLTYTTKHGYEFLENSNLFGGELILSNIGSIGKCFIVPNLGTKMTLAPNSVMIRLTENKLRDYLYNFILSPQGYLELQNITSGTAMKKFNKTDLKKILIPIPPLDEQQRIVAKVNELMTFVDEYSIKEQELETLNATFPETLKKSILQEAVQGKLVPQNKEDEPASVLLERIRDEKQKLIKEGKIKKDKQESVIFRRDNSHYEKLGETERCIDNEIPFEIPESWEFCRLSNLCQFIGGYAYKSTDFLEKSSYQVLRLGNIKNDEIKPDTNPVFISKQLAENTDNFKALTNDILLTMTGTRLKRDYFYSVRISEKDKNFFINQRVGCLRSLDAQISNWLIYIIKSEIILTQVFQYETGTANQGNLGAESIMKTLIPLPPLSEQQRIVAKIEKLMPIIKEL